MNNKDTKHKEINDTKQKEINNKILDKKEQQVKKPKIDYKVMYKKSQLEVERLNKKIKELVFENNKNIDDFQSKAEGFQSKAQKEINKIKEEIITKAKISAAETKKYGAQSLLENILEPINNIDVAIEAGEKQNNPEVMAYVQGFKMLMNQLFIELENYGIKIIEPKVGDGYNPKFHQAFSTIEGKTSNIISQVKKKGYMLHDRVIKPAIVIIIK